MSDRAMRPTPPEALPKSDCQQVCFWHLADINVDAENVRSWG